MAAGKEINRIAGAYESGRDSFWLARCAPALLSDEMGLSSWLVAGMIPGVSREPLKKIDPNAEMLLQLLYRWRDDPP